MESGEEALLKSGSEQERVGGEKAMWMLNLQAILPYYGVLREEVVLCLMTLSSCIKLGQVLIAMTRIVPGMRVRARVSEHT